MAKDYRRTNEFKEIRQSLLQQLEENGNLNPHFKGLVEDYMRLWIIKNQLIDDIDERGVVCKYQNGKEQWGYKRNDSVGELNKVSSQMLKILTQLKINVKEVDCLDDGDDDEL